MAQAGMAPQYFFTQQSDRKLPWRFRCLSVLSWIFMIPLQKSEQIGASNSATLSWMISETCGNMLLIQLGSGAETE
jgi:hypothetical protein